MSQGGASDTGLTAAPPVTRVVLVRHGETDWNRERRIQGQTDTPLSALGRLQAHAIGRRLAATERFAAIHASDLARAWDTAQAIAHAAAGHHATHHATHDATQDTPQDKTHDGVRSPPPMPVSQPQLREMDFGEWEGRTSAEISLSHPAAHARSKARDPDFRIPGGESFRDLYARAVSCVTALVHAHPGQSICVVAHGGILDMIYRHTHGIALDQPRVFSLYNAAFNCLEHDGARFRLEVWGDVAHLDAVSDAVVA